VLLDTRCTVCARPATVVCRSCEADLAPAPALAPPLHLDALHALFAYDEVARPVLTGLKNQHRRDAVQWLADRLAGPVPPSVELVTWAPTGLARRRRRGFDQAELLARAVARRWRLPAVPLLRRAPGPPQSGRSGRERRANPTFASIAPAAPAVALVDDVVTTGATLTAAARALRAAGALNVQGFVVAQAPQRGAA
jgi:ComF family protein